MFFRKLARSLALLVWLPLVLTTCGGASFEDPSKITGVRVLAVQKSAPYPKPGELVNLKLLFWDGKSSEDNPRDIFVFISPVPCENPIGDLYYNCLTELGGNPDAGTQMPDAGTPDGDVPEAGAARQGAPSFRGVGPSDWVRATRSEATSPFHDPNHIRETTVRISDDIILNHAPRPGESPDQRYGLAYVLFLACAGFPKPIPNAGPNTLPFGCFDAQDRQLGPDDFVIGYTSMYSYLNRVNHNPVIDDLFFDAESLAGSTADGANLLHIPSCKETDRTKCPKHVVKPAINRAETVEIDDDPSAKTPDGQQLEEQAWVNYYITAGELKSSVRLVNDATRGWNEKNEAEFTAPAESGPVRVFAIVHDNRGGVAWVEGKIFVD